MSLHLIVRLSYSSNIFSNFTQKAWLVKFLSASVFCTTIIDKTSECELSLTVKTDVSDYTLITILSIIDKNNKVYLVVFHSQTFISAELNYNTYCQKSSKWTLMFSIFLVFYDFSFLL